MKAYVYTAKGSDGFTYSVRLMLEEIELEALQRVGIIGCGIGFCACNAVLLLPTAMGSFWTLGRVLFRRRLHGQAQGRDDGSGKFHSGCESVKPEPVKHARGELEDAAK